MVRAKEERKQRDMQKLQDWEQAIQSGGLANQQFQNENIYRPAVTTVTNAIPSTSYMASAVLNK